MNYKIIIDNVMQSGMFTDDFSYHKGDYFDWRKELYEVVGVTSTTRGYFILRMIKNDAKEDFFIIN